MKPERFMILLSVSVLASVCWAAEERIAPMKASELPEYNQLRDPFWPIGYERKIVVAIDPTVPKTPDKAVVIEPKWPKLKLKAITSSPKGFIAIVEGVDGVGLVVAGDVVRMTLDGVVYSWHIDEISKKGFSYTQLDAKPKK